MTDQGDHAVEIRALRGRMSRLIEAGVRINSSLEFETVLQEVVEAAKDLTGARYGLIATVDQEGQPKDLVTSGLTQEEHRAIEHWPDGPRFFELVCGDLSAPLRVEDMPTHARSLGFSGDLMRWGSFLGTPMRHFGEHLGNFYLVEKARGQAFTDEDEETLVLFAAQAATALANARAYREERRARANLEAILETSPVAVVVFDAATGQPVSLNREAERLAAPMLDPAQSFEELLQVMTCKRGDGREFSLKEFPMVTHMDQPSRVRAEEIELSSPDGRRVRTLINATPIYGTEGEVMSMVVALQDLAPLEELERARAQFLGLVSHELRAPLMAIKGSASSLQMHTATLDPAELREYARLIDEQAEQMRALVTDLLDAGHIEAGTLSVTPIPEAVSSLIEHARSTFVSGARPHPVLVDLPSDLPPVMAERRRILQVLNNLFANATQHAPVSTPIRVSVERQGTHVAISVADEGRGITPERLSQVFKKQGVGGSDEGSGGLGLAICRGLVEAHGGRIWAESAGPGQGARFTFTLPAAIDSDSTSSIITAPNRSEADGSPLVLVLDDDPRTLRHVRDALTKAGYRVQVTGDHRELAGMIRITRPDLVLLDLMLPGTDGIELMERLPELSETSVIFISGYGREETVVKALNAGAVDYIVKPFSAAELTARVAAALHRRGQPEPITLGGLTIDFGRREVTVDGGEIELTATEFDLLRVLALNPGRVLTYESLLRQVWHGRRTKDVRVIHAYVKRLRRRLGDNADAPSYIVTERGVGYRMKDNPGR